jgi:hypothetical protein
MGPDREHSVPIETPDCVDNGPALLTAGNDVHLVDDVPAPRQVWRRTAGVREDVFDVGRPREAVAVVHLRHGACGFGREIDQRIR